MRTFSAVSYHWHMRCVSTQIVTSVTSLRHVSDDRQPLSNEARLAHFALHGRTRNDIRTSSVCSYFSGFPVRCQAPSKDKLNV